MSHFTKIFIGFCIFFSSSGALAEEPRQHNPSALTTQPRKLTPMESALSSKLTNEVNSSLSCEANVIVLKEALEKSEAKIKELEKASEEKK